MKWLFVLCALCALVLPASALDREAFTYTKYDLTIRLEPAQQRLGARGTVMLRNDSATPRRNVVLQISSTLDWRAIRFHGQPVQFLSQPYISDIDHTGALSEAIVTLPQAVAPGSTVDLEIAYEGTIPLDATRLVRIGVPQEEAKHSDWDQISDSFTAVRGIGYVAWYPIATEAASLSDANSVFDTIARWKQRETHAQVHIRLDYLGEGAAPMIFCNGIAPTESAANGEQNKAQRECSYASMATSAPLFVMGDYATLDRPDLRVFYLPAEKTDAEAFANEAEKAVPFVKDWFVSGARQSANIPGKAQFIDLPDAAAAPFESGSTLLTPLQGMDPALAGIVAVHQLTHAAFYSPRSWIYEGLAYFSQAAYREQQAGRQAALDLLGLHLSAIRNAEKAVAAAKQANSPAADSLINTSIEEFYRSKAAYVWWMLRDMVGEAALKQALKNYRAADDTSPAYIQHLLEQASHRDLEAFFDDWVYRDRGLPDFYVESIYPRPLLKEGYLITVTVANSGDAGAEVPVRMQMAEGDSSKRLLVPAKGKASIRIEVPQLPQQIIVNDGSVPESDTSNNVFRVKATQQK